MKTITSAVLMLLLLAACEPEHLAMETHGDMAMEDGMMEGS